MKETPKGRPLKKPERKFKKISISLHPDVDKMLRDAAYETGKSASQLVSECILLEVAKMSDSAKESGAEKKPSTVIENLNPPRSKKASTTKIV